jgi:hypothetical protein
VIDDKDFDGLLKSEQAAAGAHSLALMIADYYQSLRQEGLPAGAALVLARDFQTAVLTMRPVGPTANKGET